MLYQQQAQRPTLTASPSGDGPDLAQLDLPAADAIMLLAAHISRHGTLTEWLDASIIDESDPSKRDPDLDLYDPNNPNQPPYSAQFLTRYRQAQIDRNRRITAWVKDKLAELEASGAPTPMLRSSASWCTAPWPTRAGSIPASTPTSARPAPAIWVIRRW
ncbi:putative alpha/beta hydrolase [Mycobacterium ulcerans str. Harvey]|uniref:Alpha/beta hydrolase n=1 Tax=Mycobacterium ulcerans str. Harvey TaxID=1299332 RepID=A0ABN0QY65_MYCUL|nr:putative alpha/beta hydrolase [Mycobacterium ulcerans str. Harvey]